MSKGPKSITIIRHAERPLNPKDKHLSTRGKMRAAALRYYEFDKPDFIFAAAASSESIRSIETIRPFAKKHNLKINKTIQDKDYKKLAKLLFSKKKYNNKNILICWHHGTIPNLIESIGAKLPNNLNPWPKYIFDYIITMHLLNKTILKIEVIPQKLLYNDCDFVLISNWDFPNTRQNP